MTANLHGPLPLQVAGALSAASLHWARSAGESLCTVIAKTTYALLPGECALSAQPLPILVSDAHWFDDPRRSACRAADWAPHKVACEVTLSGSAFCPPGEERDHVVARLVVGSIDKAIEAHAARTLGPDGEIRIHGRQRQFPLAWELATGQGGTDNPVGVDCDRGALPSLQPHGFVPSRAADPPTVGFAPIAPSWPSRRRLLRPEHVPWVTSRFASVMPEGFDPRWFQAAPVDQWLDAPLAADAAFVLEGLHPGHERLVTRLPRLEPRLYVWSPRERVHRMGPTRSTSTPTSAT